VHESFAITTTLTFDFSYTSSYTMGISSSTHLCLVIVVCKNIMFGGWYTGAGICGVWDWESWSLWL
jgi:hypothetical protein